ncbi:MAG: hypothetical protein HYU36_01580 [Planctomycetes bacterium]|nr:hypothetical protein [Planctomycetota bacterium]
MIGGTDRVIPTKAGVTALDVCVRVILREWPKAVFEDATTGVVYPSYESLSFRDLTELFVYRDQEIAQSWNEHGAIPALANTMIHLLGRKDELTLVADSFESGPVSRIFQSIEAGLRMDILNLPAQLRKVA